MRLHAKSILMSLCVVLFLSLSHNFAQEQKPQDPTQIPLSPVVKRLLDDPINSESDKIKLQLFHGQFESLDVPKLNLEQRGQWALARYKLSDTSLTDPKTPILIQAKAALLTGNPQDAITLLKNPNTLEQVLIKANAYEDLGQLEQATQLLFPWVNQIKKNRPENAADLTHAGILVSKLAQLEGLPARDYQQAMDWFSKAHEQMDRLYWPAHLAQAQLLFEKGSRSQTVKAIMDTLALSPNCSEAWLLLGRMSVDSFQFKKTATCVEKLRKINPRHLLADILEVRSLLAQRDLKKVPDTLKTALAKYPTHRTLLALQAAMLAMQFDHAGLEKSLDHFEKLSPGNPLALAIAGKFLSFARQYDWAEQLLRKAITMQPNWPKPRNELALLLMQAGRDEQALGELKKAAALDPFHKQVQNQLELAMEMQGFKTLKTKHFLITYPPGVEEVLALDMQDILEQIFFNVTSSFSHSPKRITQIQIMPNERWFGVRITGIPEIWTIAACTGDVIAMTPPKTGARQRGAYDWARVIQHEFTHTVTLDMTHNRLAHWFTEACAVAMEPGGRDYNTCQLLAHSLINDKLFDLQAINWAFIRPKEPSDRSLAYAQANWMYDYITATFGHDAILKILDQFAKTNDSQVVIQTVTGQDENTFMQGFKRWANEQIQDWGLGEQDGDDSLEPLLKAFAQGIAPPAQLLTKLVTDYPDHPEVLKLHAQVLMTEDDPKQARAAVLAYAQARPVDPWPHVQMVKLAQKLDHQDELIGALTALDHNEQSTGQWAFELAKLYGKDKKWNEAMAAAKRAVMREPYNADYRELTATMALMSRDLQQALHQIRALTLLEPKHPIHWRRLAAIAKKMGNKELEQKAIKQGQGIRD